MAPPGIGHKAPMNVAKLSGGTMAAAALAMTPRALSVSVLPMEARVAGSSNGAARRAMAWGIATRRINFSPSFAESDKTTLCAA